MGLLESVDIRRESLDSERQPLLGSQLSYPAREESLNSTVIHSDEEEKKKSSCVQLPEWISVGVILANLIIGIGLLNFPAAYRDGGGLLPSISLQMVSVLFVTFGMFQIVRAQEACGSLTYQETIRYYLGPVGLLICDILIVVHNLGTCAILLVLLADQIDSVSLYVYGPDFCRVWYLQRRFTLTMVSCILILPACFPKNIHAYKYTSFIGLISTIYILWLAIWKYAQMGDNKYTVQRSKPLTPWMDMFKVIPTVCFSFEGHIEAVPLFAGCREKTHARSTFMKGMLLCMSLCVLTYTMTGIFGYLTFGQDVTSDFLTSYQPIDVSIIVATAIMAVKVITSYPVIFYCARLVVEEFTSDDPLAIRDRSSKANRCCSRGKWGCKWWTETVKRVVISSILFSFTLGLAISVPSIGSVIPLLGGSGSLFVFVFPGLCYMELHLNSENKRSRWLAYTGAFMAVLGSFTGGTTTAQSVYRYLAGEFMTKEMACYANYQTQ